jgi:NAD(P)-dependent dehydrogenase (short-subunit alcohol dehydrogenase family)
LTAHDRIAEYPRDMRNPTLPDWTLPYRMDGRVALVTGGTGTLGTAVCRVLAAAGATVIVSGRDAERNERAAGVIRKAGGVAEAVRLDLADPVSIEVAVEATLAHHGRLDVLVNNAISRFPGHVEQYRLDDWEASMRIDSTGWFLVTQLSLRAMLQQGAGSLVSIASVLGMVSAEDRLYPAGIDGFRPNYFFVKAGVVGFTRFLAASYAGRGIRANCVSPGGIETDPPRDDSSRFVERTPMRRLGRPDEIAAAVHYLASDASSYITGHNLVVDGGYTAW